MCVPEGIRNSNPNAFPGQVRRDPGPAPAFARRVGRRRLCSSLTPPEHSDDGLPGTGEVTQASVLLLKLPANRHRPVVIEVVGKRCRCPQRECGMKTAVSGGRCAAICDPCGQRKEGARIGPHRTHAQPGSVAQNQARASGGMKPVEGVTQVLGSGHGCRTRPKQVDRLLCGDAPRVNGDQPEELSRLPCRHVHRLRTPLEGRAAEKPQDRSARVEESGADLRPRSGGQRREQGERFGIGVPVQGGANDAVAQGQAVMATVDASP